MNAKQQPIDRSRWSLVGPVHIAETREQALKNVRHGIDAWITYFREVAALPIAPADSSDPAQALIESGLAVIGTPDDAIAQVNRLQEQSGGFGTFLQMAHNWADWEQTKDSYRLFARYVAPEFQSKNINRVASYDWAASNHEKFMDVVDQAILSEIEIDEKEKSSKTGK